MPKSNVVITGLGVVSSIGIGGDAFFRALLDKRSGITSLSQRTDDGAKPGPDAQPPGIWIGAPIVDFDPKQYVRPRKALKVMCREIQTAFAASQLAIENAELSGLLPADPAGELKPSEVGTVLGSEMFYGPPAEMEDAFRGCIRKDGTIDMSLFGGVAMRKIMPLWMLKYLPNMPACHIGIALNAHGPNNTQVLGDVSGPAAMMEAASCVERGIAKVMIAGATGTRINTTRMNYRGDLPVPDAFDPVENSSRPFDPMSKGVVGGEGAAALVLENADNAAKRGRKPIARLVSCAARFIPSQRMTGKYSSDSSEQAKIGSPDAIRLAIESAMQDAGVTSQQIGLVVSHAMGDRSIDSAEREALHAVVPRRPVTAPMASLGHTGAASGAMSLATAVLALANGIVPPTLQTVTTASDVGLCEDVSRFEEDYVLSVAHTSQGNATAIILARA